MAGRGFTSLPATCLFQQMGEFDIGSAFALIQQAIDFLQSVHLYGFIQATLVVLIASTALWMLAGKGT